MFLIYIGCGIQCSVAATRYRLKGRQFSSGGWELKFCCAVWVLTYSRRPPAVYLCVWARRTFEDRVQTEDISRKVSSYFRSSIVAWPTTRNLRARYSSYAYSQLFHIGKRTRLTVYKFTSVYGRPPRHILIFSPFHLGVRPCVTLASSADLLYRISISTFLHLYQNCYDI